MFIDLNETGSYDGGFFKFRKRNHRQPTVSCKVDDQFPWSYSHKWHTVFIEVIVTDGSLYNFRLLNGYCTSSCNRNTFSLNIPRRFPLMTLHNLLYMWNKQHSYSSHSFVRYSTVYKKLADPLEYLWGEFLLPLQRLLLSFWTPMVNSCSNISYYNLIQCQVTQFNSSIVTFIKNMQCLLITELPSFFIIIRKLRNHIYCAQGRWHDNKY